MAKELNFSLLWAIGGGILFWIICVLLEDTQIFGAIANLPAIGLFLGFMLGGFKDKLDIL